MREKERKEWLRIWIKLFLTKELKCAKNSWRHNVNDYQNQLIGLLQYAQSVKDIDEETYEKVRKLSYTIRTKYSI